MTDTPTPARARAYAPRMAGEARRQQLLDAALAVIVEHGIHKVSIDSVAREAGVTRPVVYGHFEDTGALRRASLEREEARVLEQWAAAMPDAEVADPLEAVVASFTTLLDAMLTEPDLWRAVFSLVDSSTPEFRERVDHGRAVAISAIEDLIEQHAAWAGGVTDAHLEARALLAVLWDLGRQALSDPATYPRDRLVRFVEASLRRRLR